MVLIFIKCIFSLVVLLLAIALSCGLARSAFSVDKLEKAGVALLKACGVIFGIGLLVSVMLYLLVSLWM